MANDPRAELTERQRQLLELIAQDITTSKELARETGLTPGSIDTILQGAGRVLGVRNRIAAARRYRELEEQNSQLGSQLRVLSFQDRLKFAAMGLARAGGRGAEIGIEKFASLFRIVPLGGRKHALSWQQITLEVLRVAALGLVGLFALVLVVLGFFKTFG